MPATQTHARAMEQQLETVLAKLDTLRDQKLGVKQQVALQSAEACIRATMIMNSTHNAN